LDLDPDTHLLQPVGVFPPEAKSALLETASRLTYPLRIVGVCERFLEENLDFVRAFTVNEDQAASNYLYRAKDLAKLSGRKYAKKRNLISQAKSQYKWNARLLTPDLTPLCFQVLDTIIEEEHPDVEGMLERELAALERTLRNLEELEQQGLLIIVDDRPVAFSIFEAISPDTVAIHFERALRACKGLYQIINWEAAKVIEARGFGFINREEDLGDAGLRDAKMSYHPVKIIPSYELVYKHRLAS
ncbi:MAG TPA: phosphatidylglycerol lysyltransferase domain-containing protein, partial [Acidobacteriota bacterium]|nr:phosphatidylglycerol lysyltransferase domain-containing protein [Acidobacteriota bacterium]